MEGGGEEEGRETGPTTPGDDVEGEEGEGPEGGRGVGLVLEVEVVENGMKRGDG